MTESPYRIWQFCDGKTGHERQSAGLIAAIARLHPVETWRLPPFSTVQVLRGICGSPVLPHMPAPDMIIGAGHGTHLSLWIARRTRGGKSVVLMRPSLPLWLFDLCVIPEHDTPPRRANVLATRGALNALQPSATLDVNHGLFLIGGPSAHFDWDNAALCAQITAISAATPTVQWTLTTSRRTPPSFLTFLTQQMRTAHLNIVPVAETGPEWLPMQLARAATVWVSADSVSMIYEALTAGAHVGVLDVPQKRLSRISEGLAQLIAEESVTPFACWQTQQQFSPRSREFFCEADRIAHWMVTTWRV